MRRIPTDIFQIINGVKNTQNLILKTDSFALVIDPTHTEISDHYCAWSLNSRRDLLSLTKDDVPELEELKESSYKLLSMNDKTHKAFIHFPPSWWQLHIHFVQNNHFLLCPKEDIHYLDDVIHNLKTNTDYYRERVTIGLKSRKSNNSTNKL